MRGGDPWCSGALSADGRWVRIHTTAPAVGSASKLSAPGALRRTSEVGSSHSLSAYEDSPTIVLERYYSARRKLCNLTKAAATAQPLRRGNTCVDSVAHPTASTSRHVVAPKAIVYRNRWGRPYGQRLPSGLRGFTFEKACGVLSLTSN